MPTNPFHDTIAFLTGNTGDYDAVGAVRYLPVALFLAMIAASIAIAWTAWQRDPEQRTARHLAIWLMRATTAGLWYQGSIWKLPLPVSGAFTHWTTELATNSALPFHAALVNHILPPGIAVIQPLVYLMEVSLAASLLLGFAVRLSDVLAAAFTAHLLLGLYNDPTEWAWTYCAIIVAHGMFAATEAGRSLGLDHLLRRDEGRVLPGRPLLRRAYLLAS